MELPDHVVAQQLRHDDGGTLVRELYGHPDAAMARERIRAAFRDAAPVVALPEVTKLVTTPRKRPARAKHVLPGPFPPSRKAAIALPMPSSPPPDASPYPAVAHGPEGAAALDGGSRREP